jgi:hypothetical protein
MDLTYFVMWVWPKNPEGGNPATCIQAPHALVGQQRHSTTPQNILQLETRGPAIHNSLLHYAPTATLLKCLECYSVTTTAMPLQCWDAAQSPPDTDTDATCSDLVSHHLVRVTAGACLPPGQHAQSAAVPPCLSQAARQACNADGNRRDSIHIPQPSTQQQITSVSSGQGRRQAQPTSCNAAWTTVHGMQASSLQL